VVALISIPRTLAASATVVAGGGPLIPGAILRLHAGAQREKQPISGADKLKKKR
jgi:hypothetical protein